MSSAIALGVLAVGATAYGANRAGAAADKQVEAANRASQSGDAQYDQARIDNAPRTVTGNSAINQLGRLFGLETTTPEAFAAKQPVTVGDTQLPAGTTTVPTGGGNYRVIGSDGLEIGTLGRGGPNGLFRPNGATIAQPASPAVGSPSPPMPDRSGFTASPGYQFRRDEGTRDIGNSFGAAGGAFSGNALKALAEFNSGLASQEFGNYVNQLGTIAGIGGAATSENNQLGANNAAITGRNSLYAGDGRASGVENQANIIGEGINQLGSMAGYYSKNRKPKPLGGTGYGSAMPTSGDVRYA